LLICLHFCGGNQNKQGGCVTFQVSFWCFDDVATQNFEEILFNLKRKKERIHKAY